MKLTKEEIKDLHQVQHILNDRVEHADEYENSEQAASNFVRYKKLIIKIIKELK